RESKWETGAHTCAFLDNVPYFGICLGMQTALIEGVRNLLGEHDANSEEFCPDCPRKGKHTLFASLLPLVVVFMPETSQQTVMGASMRLGDRPTDLSENSLTYNLYDGEKIIVERHRHRYEF